MFSLTRAFPFTTSAEADASIYASTPASRLPSQDSRPGGSLLLSCKALSSSTACRFIPAHFLTRFSLTAISGTCAALRGSVRYYLPAKVRGSRDDQGREFALL